MAREMVSKKTRTAFREYMTGFTLREIDDEFSAVGLLSDLTHDPGLAGQRRTLIEQYYADIDFGSPRDVQRLLEVYEAVLVTASSLAARMPDDTARQSAIEELCLWLRRDGFEYSNGRLRRAGTSGLTDSLRDIVLHRDAEHLAQHIHRIEASIESDPALAIGSAKELVETCCKMVLEARGELTSESLEFPKLAKKTFATLRLLPGDVPDTARGAQSIRQLLSNLAAVTHALSEIRNLYGTGHGRSGRVRGLSARHARLAVGAAVALSTFLLDTQAERESQR